MPVATLYYTHDSHIMHVHTNTYLTPPHPPQVTLFLGKLNAIAPFVTMFFLVSYMVVNLACFALKVAAAPNFRPTFQIYARYTCKCIQYSYIIGYWLWGLAKLASNWYSFFQHLLSMNDDILVENPYSLVLQLPLDSSKIR